MGPALSLWFCDSGIVLLLNLTKTKNSLEKYAHVHIHRIVNMVSGGQLGFLGHELRNACALETCRSPPPLPA